MKSKYLIFAILLSALFFALGFYVNSPNESDAQLVDSITTEQPKKQDSTQVKPTTAKRKIDFAKVLKGKFVLDGSNYAGYEFIDAKTISWTNELFPMDPDTMSIKWINENTFVTKFTKRVNKECPPGLSILKVMSHNDGKLILKEYWTGWNDRKDELLNFHQSVN